MKYLFSALQFLTIFRFSKSTTPGDLASSMPLFPVVGLALGAVLAISGIGLSILHIDQFVINALIVIMLIAMTGAMHLDALADTCDALLSHRPREEMLRIMRDPHIGTMGAVAISSDILLKIALLSGITTSFKAIALILMCLFGRWSMVLAIHLFPYARDDGKARIFADMKSARVFVIATVISAAMAAAIWGLRGVACFSLTACVAYMSGRYINARLGGMTGDTIGATGELSEIATLFFVSILQRSFL